MVVQPRDISSELAEHVNFPRDPFSHLYAADLVTMFHASSLVEMAHNMFNFNALKGRRAAKSKFPGHNKLLHNICFSYQQQGYDFPTSGLIH